MKASDILFWLLRGLAMIETYRKLKDATLRRTAAGIARHHFREYGRRLQCRLMFAAREVLP